MRRELKTYARPEKPTTPVGNTLTVDLGGLRLTSEQLELIRANAIKAALLSAYEATRATQPNALADFGTFSTFSTFSTFGSGAQTPIGVPADVQQLVNNVVGAKARP